jgi:hypothetical protein
LRRLIWPDIKTFQGSYPYFKGKDKKIYNETTASTSSLASLTLLCLATLLPLPITKANRYYLESGK